MRKLLLLPLLLAAACDGGSGPSGGAELSAAEAADVLRVLNEPRVWVRGGDVVLPLPNAA